jgi:uncharacterized oligopeptide transporter (OPT) family protein
MVDQTDFGPGVPALPADATPQQKDEHWFKHVYKGDTMPQLTFRAVLLGGFLGMLMAASNLYTTLYIGWAFGVAITACVMSYVIWNLLRLVSGNTISEMSMLENNCMASTASAAGYSTGSAVAAMFGAMLLIHREDGKTSEQISNLSIQPWWIVAAFTLCTGLMGTLLAIPMKRQMINNERLRFPSGVAAAETLRSLYSKSSEAVQKASVLITGIIFGGTVGIINTGEGTLPFLDRFHEWTHKHLGFMIRIPESFSLNSIYNTKVHGKVAAGYDIDSSVLLLAAGIITRLRVCVSMLIGSMILYFIVGPALLASDVSQAPASGWYKNDAGAYVYDIRTRAPGFVQNIELNVPAWTTGTNSEVVAKDPTKYADDPEKPTQFSGVALKYVQWALWGGTAIMVFASLTSVALQWRTILRAFSGIGVGGPKAAPSEHSKIEVPTSWMVAGMVPIAIAMLALQVLAFNISWWAGLIAIGMSFVLSLVASRATGETDTTPMGAMGKVMQLIFAVIQPGRIEPNLASAGIAANSAIASADLLTDLKSGYLLGANPRRQFIAQFAGVFFGTIAIVPIWYLMVPNQAALEKFAAPGTRQWVAVAQVLTQGLDQLPRSAKLAALCGALLGIGLPIVENLTPRKYRGYLPSAMGLGLSWVIPFSSAIGFFLGAVVGWLWEILHKKSAAMYAVALASGLIAGESLIKAIVAMTATAIKLATLKTP